MTTLNYLQQQSVQGCSSPRRTIPETLDIGSYTTCQYINWANPSAQEGQALVYPTGALPCAINHHQVLVAPKQNRTFQPGAAIIPAHSMTQAITLTSLLPSPPEKDSSGNYPPKPNNLPQPPDRPSRVNIREWKFGQLLPSERPMSDEELVSATNEFIWRLTLWRCWAEKMPKEWGLVDDSTMAEQNDAEAMNDSKSPGLFYLLLLVACFHFFCYKLNFWLLAFLMFAIVSPVIEWRLIGHSLRYQVTKPTFVAFLRKLCGILSTICFQTFNALRKSFIPAKILFLFCIVGPSRAISEWHNGTHYIDTARAQLINVKHDIVRELRLACRYRFWIGLMTIMSACSLAAMSEQLVKGIAFSAAVIAGLLIPLPEWLNETEEWAPRREKNAAPPITPIRSHDVPRTDPDAQDQSRRPADFHFLTARKPGPFGAKAFGASRQPVTHPYKTWSSDTTPHRIFT